MVLVLLFFLITTAFSGCVNTKEELTPTPTPTPTSNITVIPPPTYAIVLPWDLEEAIFDEINNLRAKNNISVLRWNEKVAEVARNHSEDMDTREYFAHSNPEGEYHYDRLLNDGVFFIVTAENLYSYPWGGEANLEYIAKEIVEGWLESPGHRSIILDRDELYSDIGIGVSYGQECYYITADFIGIEWERVVSLDYDYTIFYYLYDPSWDIGFSDEIVAEIKISTIESLDVYIVSNKKEYDNFLRGGAFDYVDYYKECQYINKTRKVMIGEGVILSNEYYNAPINVSLNVYYPS